MPLLISSENMEEGSPMVRGPEDPVMQLLIQAGFATEQLSRWDACLETGGDLGPIATAVAGLSLAAHYTFIVCKVREDPPLKRMQWHIRVQRVSCMLSFPSPYCTHYCRESMWAPTGPRWSGSRMGAIIEKR